MSEQKCPTSCGWCVRCRVAAAHEAGRKEGIEEGRRQAFAYDTDVAIANHAFAKGIEAALQAAEHAPVAVQADRDLAPVVTECIARVRGAIAYRIRALLPTPPVEACNCPPDGIAPFCPVNHTQGREGEAECQQCAGYNAGVWSRDRDDGICGHCGGRHPGMFSKAGRP